MRKKCGYLEVITGGMYAGKSEELIRRLRRLGYAKKRFQLYKPIIDNRYSSTEVVTHDGMKIPCRTVSSEWEIIEQVTDEMEYVGIDEVQFFSHDILKVIDILLHKGIIVIVAGLDMYSTGEPFGPMGELLAKSKYMDKLHAVCVGCGGKAYISYKVGEDTLANRTNTVAIGSNGEYIALCEVCACEREREE